MSSCVMCQMPNNIILFLYRFSYQKIVLTIKYNRNENRFRSFVRSGGVSVHIYTCIIIINTDESKKKEGLYCQ